MRTTLIYCSRKSSRDATFREDGLRAKPALAVLTLLLLTVGLVACGGDEGSADWATQADTAGGADASPDNGAPCTPACGGKTCGPDGCGGSCGACYDTQGARDDSLCVDGACCTPTCQGKTCGDNGCGGVCGVCYNAQGAVDEGLCVAGVCGGSTTGTCTEQGFVPFKSTVKLTEGEAGHPYLVYQASSAASLPRDDLLITLRPGSHGGPEAPGVYPLTGENYKDAGIRVLLLAGCNAASGCEETYFATSGTLTIHQTGGTGVTFRASLDATLTKVDIDPATGISSPSANARTRCLSGYSIIDVIKPDYPEPACVTEGTGPLVNDNIADFQLQNCNGDWFGLHSLCGQQKAVWIYVVAGWCPVCHQTLPADSAYAREKVAQGKKLRLVTVLGEDATGNPPSLAYCKQYAAEHDVDPAWTFVDPLYETTFTNIYVYPGPDGSFGLPWAAHLDGDNMAYAWHSGGTSGPKDTFILNQLLAD